MRKLDRASVVVPPSLANPAARVANEISAAHSYYAARTPWMATYTSFPFKAYRANDVGVALRALAHGKCAYCESKIEAVRADEVEHYRPKGGIDGDPLHPGYWWLAHRWDNLLPTCRGCNHRLRGFVVTPEMTTEQIEKLRARRGTSTLGKGNQFPIGGDRVAGPPTAGNNGDAELALEDPYLIDPCRRDPEPELTWKWDRDLSLVEASRREDGSISPYGEQTIVCCALNRFELVDERTEILDELRVQRTQIIEDLEAAGSDPARIAAALDRAHTMRRHAEPTKRYSVMSGAFVDSFLEELENWLLTNTTVAAAACVEQPIDDSG